jgi:hypothetical protein
MGNWTVIFILTGSNPKDGHFQVSITITARSMEDVLNGAALLPIILIGFFFEMLHSL